MLCRLESWTMSMIQDPDLRYYKEKHDEVAGKIARGEWTTHDRVVTSLQRSLEMRDVLGLHPRESERVAQVLVTLLRAAGWQIRAVPGPDAPPVEERSW